MPDRDWVVIKMKATALFSAEKDSLYSMYLERQSIETDKMLTLIPSSYLLRNNAEDLNAVKSIASKQRVYTLTWKNPGQVKTKPAILNTLMNLGFWNMPDKSLRPTILVLLVFSKGAKSRKKIMVELRTSPKNCNQLSEITGLAWWTIKKHLIQLQKENLISELSFGNSKYFTLTCTGLDAIACIQGKIKESNRPTNQP
jgi:hypothetical protein